MNAVSNTIANATAAAPDQILDARGLNCPLPVLKTKVLLGRMEAGQLLRVTATDPHARIDFEAYCARSGHELLAIQEADGVMEFLIRRARNPNRT
jgi:tRNA 2-thiouridine synthesizing protein A